MHQQQYIIGDSYVGRVFVNHIETSEGAIPKSARLSLTPVVWKCDREMAPKRLFDLI